MFTQETVSTSYEPAFDGERASGIATDATALGWFDWGWPSLNTRRLARASLIDVAGREPLPAVRDAFVPVARTRAPLTALGASR